MSKNNEDKDLDFNPKKPDVDIHDKIDHELLKVKDRVKLIDDIKTSPPPPGVINVKLENVAHEIDLNTLLSSQIVDCPATVIPMLIDHGVRTAVDIKETYKPEKRFLDFQYWWLIILILGSIAMVMILNMIFGIF